MMDRRLRAIVEAIRVQNLKQAWKLANGLDQKKPGWKALEVLKAVILDKWGKTEEADRLIQQLDNDWQEETLQALQVSIYIHIHSFLTILLF
jgi:thioredoxin-like negative regulator of GroEL